MIAIVDHRISIATRKGRQTQEQLQNLVYEIVYDDFNFSPSLFDKKWRSEFFCSCCFLLIHLLLLSRPCFSFLPLLLGACTISVKCESSDLFVYSSEPGGSYSPDNSLSHFIGCPVMSCGLQHSDQGKSVFMMLIIPELVNYHCPRQSIEMSKKSTVGYVVIFFFLCSAFIGLFFKHGFHC